MTKCVCVCVCVKKPAKKVATNTKLTTTIPGTSLSRCRAELNFLNPSTFTASFSRRLFKKKPRLRTPKHHKKLHLLFSLCPLSFVIFHVACTFYTFVRDRAERERGRGGKSKHQKARKLHQRDGLRPQLILITFITLLQITFVIPRPMTHGKLELHSNC